MKLAYFYTVGQKCPIANGGYQELTLAEIEALEGNEVNTLALYNKFKKPN